MAWSGFALTLRFGTDEETDTWFVKTFTLAFDLSDAKAFPNAAPGESRAGLGVGKG